MSPRTYRFQCTVFDNQGHTTQTLISVNIPSSILSLPPPVLPRSYRPRRHGDRDWDNDNDEHHGECVVGSAPFVGSLKNHQSDPCPPRSKHPTNQMGIRSQRGRTRRTAMTSLMMIYPFCAFIGCITESLYVTASCTPLKT